jgi:glucose-1-phosphate thymidylyltransferase
MVFLKEVTDPNRFGIPRFSESDPSVIEEILEKPEVAPCNLAVTGLYLYDNTVFDKIRTLKPSGRGELEVTDLNNAYIKEGKLKWATLEGFWSDAGTFESLFRTNAYWAKKVLG